MPINSNPPIVSYLGNGAANAFTYNFKIFKAADIVAQIDGVTKTFGVDYAITGAGAFTGGSVVFVTPPANLALVVLYRQISYDRLVPDYQEGGDFLANTVDGDIDRVVGQVQQLVRDVKRAIKLPIDVTVDQTIVGDAVARALQLISLDGSGNVTMLSAASVLGIPVSSFMATVLIAVNAAAARGLLGATSAADVAVLIAAAIATEVTARNTAIAARFPAGIIMGYGAASAPAGFLICDGASLLRAGTYAALFAAIGTTWGSADGTHFNVPDSRGRVIIGAGSGAGLTARALAASGGLEGVALAISEMPAHTHPGSTFPASTTSSPGTFAFHGNSLEANQPITVASQGGGGTHENMQPWLAATAIISF